MKFTRALKKLKVKMWTQARLNDLLFLVSIFLLILFCFMINLLFQHYHAMQLVIR